MGDVTLSVATEDDSGERPAQKPQGSCQGQTTNCSEICD